MHVTGTLCLDAGRVTKLHRLFQQRSNLLLLCLLGVPLFLAHVGHLLFRRRHLHCAIFLVQLLAVLRSVLRQHLLFQAFKLFLVLHGVFSFHSSYGLLYGGDEPLQPRLFLRQHLQMLLQGRVTVKVPVVQHLFDLLQRHFQGTIEQNLLQPIHLLLAIDAVAVAGNARRFEQVDAVVVAQGATADPGQLRQLVYSVFHGPLTSGR